jgi:hypothetical protein
MCDLSTLDALREQAQSAPEVTVKSEILLKLLDPVMVVTINAPKKRAKRERPPVDPGDKVCAEWLLKVRDRTAPKMKKPNIEAWSDDIRIMREQDGRERKEICELFLWAHKNDFWCANILSPKALREHWDRLFIQASKAAEPMAGARETVEARNARLQAEFLGVQSAPASAYLQLEA